MVCHIPANMLSLYDWPSTQISVWRSGSPWRAQAPLQAAHMAGADRQGAGNQLRSFCSFSSTDLGHMEPTYVLHLDRWMP